jgi:hypothetical protein
MNADPCRREADLLDALANGTWPEASDRELIDHVAACAECGELALAAATIDADRRDAEHAVALPASGAAWWRIQMRIDREMREAAARTVRRTHSAIVVATVAVVTVVLAMTSLLGAAWSWISRAMPTAADFAALHRLAPSTTTLLIAAAGVLVITPVIVWLAVAEE